MAPVVRALRNHQRFACQVLSTAQQDMMFDRTLEEFGLAVDCRLDIYSRDHRLGVRLSRMLMALDNHLRAAPPDRILVQGDTMSTLAGAMAGYFIGIPVAHVEAGLRSGNMNCPWPEEGNRRSVACYADLHFAPTEQAAANLIDEGVSPDDIAVTGNTGVDALIWARNALAGTPRTHLPVERLDGPYILATGHRKESACERHREMISGLAAAGRAEGLPVVFVLHPNPEIARPILEAGAAFPGLVFVEPQGYLDFVALMMAADLIVTDSGGVHEDAITLGRKALIVREFTERGEGIDNKMCCAVMPGRQAVAQAVRRLLLLDGERSPNRVFGDGRAAARIVEILLDRHSIRWPNLKPAQQEQTFSKSG